MSITLKAKIKRFLLKTETHLSAYGFVSTFLVLYTLSNILLFFLGASREWVHHARSDFRRWGSSIARGFGMIVNFNSALVIFVSLRSLIVFLGNTKLSMVLPFEKVIPEFHAVLGTTILSSGIIHCLFHWTLYIKYELWSTGFKGGTSLFATGIALAVITTVIRISAYGYIRRNHFERFYCSHIGGSCLFYIFLFIHGMHYGKAETWKWVIGPLSLCLLDRIVEHAREHRSYLLLSKHSAEFQGNDVLRLRLPKIFHFQAGQYVELRVPELSKFQWHPLTIASAPHEPEMVFYVKACGDWTCALYQIFSDRIEDVNDDVEIHIRGPFGSPAQHVGQFEHIVLIGGGVGATPFCSIAKAAHYWITSWMGKSRSFVRVSPMRRDQRGQTRAPWFGRKPHPRSSYVTRLTSTDKLNEMDDETPVRNATKKITFDRETTRNTDKSVNWEDMGVRKVSSMEGSDGDLDSEFLAAAAEVVARMTGDTSGSSSTSESKNSKNTRTTTTGTTFHTARNSFAVGTSSSSLSSQSSPDSGETDWSRIRPSRRLAKTRQSTESTNARNQSLKKSLCTILDIETVATSYSDLSDGGRRSLEYLSALSAAHLERNQSEVYKKSLGMLIGISYGSTALVKAMQMRRAQRSPSAFEPEEDLTIFRSKLFLLLLFMRSVTVNMLLLWLLLLRIAVASFAAVFGYLRLFENGLALYKSRVLLVLDLSTISAILLLIATPALLEAVKLGGVPHHGLDLFVLTPAAVFSVVTDILALIEIGNRVTMFGLFNVLVVWPVFVVLLSVRLIRVVGERVSLAENVQTPPSKTKSLDFIWTASGPEDDTWLVKELIPYGENKIIRLHRYLTRAEPQEEEWMQPYDRLPVRTYYEHPDWDNVFNRTAEGSLNGSTIGVFFCGPRAMEKRIRVAALNAMRNSIVRGLHVGAYNTGIEEIFGDAVRGTALRATLSRSASSNRGSNVRFVFKKERFS